MSREEREREREGRIVREKEIVEGRAEACGIGKLPGNLFVSRFEPLLNNYCVLFHVFSLSSPTLRVARLGEKIIADSTNERRKKDGERSIETMGGKTS